MKCEIWKDIKGYEGDYQISNLGRVKSLKYKKERILKYFFDKDGYKNLTLTKNGKAKKKKIHRLVAECFIKNPFNKPDVNHIDLDKSNNNVSNLEWVNKRENMKHASLNNDNCRGEGIASSKLTEKDVIKIRQMYSTKKYTYKDLSRIFKVANTTIGLIVRKETWRHLL